MSVERLEDTPPCGDSNQYAIKQKVSLERLERENLWLKRTIGEKAFSHPVSCSYGTSPLDKWLEEYIGSGD